MVQNYGEPLRYDPEFKGPVHRRSCTDILWLIVFILFMGCWGFVGYYGLRNGDIERLLAPIDSKGRRCGLDSDVIDKKYLVFFDITRCLSPETPITGCATPQVCVDKCPEKTILFFEELNASNFEQLRPSIICTDEVDVATLTLVQAVQYMRENKCTTYVIQSQPVIGRCFINATEAIENLTELAQNGFTEAQVAEYVTNLVKLEQLSAQIVEDLVQSRWYMLGGLAAVVVLCMIYIVLLRWVVAPVVWFSLVGLLALLCLSVYLCYKNYVYYKAHPVILQQTTNLKGYAQSIFTKQETWLVILIIVAIVLVVLALMIVFLRKRITIAIALIKEGSKAVGSIKSTMAFPIFPWIIHCFVIAYGVVVLMYLMSIGESTFSVVNLQNDTSCDCKGVYNQDYVQCNPATFIASCHDSSSGIELPCRQATCHFTGLVSPNIVTYFQIINVVGFFWMMFFVSGVADMMLASTFSTWYWSFHKRDVPFFTLTSGIYKTIRYHLGTVAIGALIITIVRVIRVILEYIDHKLKKFDNPFTRCVMCMCKCCCYCLENFLKFINKNAYIMCAVHGTNFCKSARDAFALLMRNIIRVVVLDKVTDFIFFLSKLLISIGVGIGVYYLMQWNYIYEVTQGQRLHNNYVPAIILAICTYLITTIFFNVYSMAVDTLFLCFLEDCERNDGSPEKPYFMSKNLMRILRKKNKIN